MADAWTGALPTMDSPYYPYQKVNEADTLAGAEQLPYILCRYLMDLPDGKGYVPPSDNKYPRARLKKLLYWDTPLPLNQPLPSPAQMRQLFFDPERPDRAPDPERGFRLFPQSTVQQSLDKSKSLIRVYMGNAQLLEMRGTHVTRQDVTFDVVVNTGIESNTGMTASSRSYDIVQCIKEAVSGVNFGGIGPMTVRLITKGDDERYNIVYKIYGYIDWCADGPNPYFT